MTHNIKTKIAAGALIAGLTTAAWAATTASLTYNGNVVSHDVRVIDGRPYVPVADVAKILGGSVAKGDAGYAITGGAVAGGANQVNGLQGKVGEMLFTGKWRFEITSVTHAQTFTTQYSSDSSTLTPNAPNNELVVLAGIVKNATPKDHQLIMSVHDLNHTALTDDQENSFPPKQFDFIGSSFYGPDMLPGSEKHFNMVFDVPKNTNLKDLICSLCSYDDSTPVDVRVSLAQ